MVHECACAYACACVFGLNNLHLDFFPCDIRTAASLDLASDLKQVGLDHFTCATTPTALFTCEATCVEVLEWRSGTTIIEQYTPLDNVGTESTLTALGTTFTTNITHNVRVDPGPHGGEHHVDCGVPHRPITGWAGDRVHRPG